LGNGGTEFSLSDKNDRQVETSVLVVVRAETDALVIAVLGSMVLLAILALRWPRAMAER
jgi:hypothetical protein